VDRDDIFHVTVTAGDVDTVVSVRGEVDVATAPTLRRVLAAVHSCLNRDASSRPIVIELSGVTLLDASGLTVLVDAARWLARDGRTLVLRDPSQRTFRVLEITRLLSVFHIEVRPSGRGDGDRDRQRRAGADRARYLEQPAQRLYAVTEADESRSLVRSGAAATVVADREPDTSVVRIHVDEHDGRLRVLRRVREGFGDDVVRGDFDPLWQPPVGA
jgi:anti-sigma B factor antagonist